MELSIVYKADGSAGEVSMASSSGVFMPVEVPRRAGFAKNSEVAVCVQVVNVTADAFNFCI